MRRTALSLVLVAAPLLFAPYWAWGQAPVPTTLAPVSATTTFSGQTNAIGTGSTPITANGLALNKTNYNTVDLVNFNASCDVWVNTSGGTAVGQSGKPIYAGGGGLSLGNVPSYALSPTGSITGISVNSGTAVPCSSGSVTLAVETH